MSLKARKSREDDVFPGPIQMLFDKTDSSFRV
jgi:hypothetical protein